MEVKFVKGFTLAEVLVTIGIIGIVAAMTLPSVITNYQKKQTVIQLKKVYSILNQAIELSEIDNENIKYWNFEQGSADFFNMYLRPYMNTINSTTRGKTSSIQYTRPNKKPANGIVAFHSSNTEIVSLEDGTTFYLQKTSSQNQYKGIYVDINGYKKPNRVGRDYFCFSILKDYGLVPYGYKKSSSEGTTLVGFDTFDRETIKNNRTYGCNYSDSAGAGMYCAALIITDNWEIRNDYPW